MAVLKRESRCMTPWGCTAFWHCFPSFRVLDRTMTAVWYSSSLQLTIIICHCGLTGTSICSTLRMMGNVKAPSTKTYISESSKFVIIFRQKWHFKFHIDIFLLIPIGTSQTSTTTTKHNIEKQRQDWNCIDLRILDT